MGKDGSNIVDVYIPWFIHEPEEGRVGFDSLRKFLDLAVGELTAVWRVVVTEIRGLVYLNGVCLEHHEPDRTPNIGRDGIYCVLPC